MSTMEEGCWGCSLTGLTGTGCALCLAGVVAPPLFLLAIPCFVAAAWIGNKPDAFHSVFRRQKVSSIPKPIDCPKCMTSNRGEAMYCRECGLQLKAAPVLPSRHIPQAIRDQVWTQYGGKCAECGSRLDLQFDHIVPHSRGGSSELANIQLLCGSCNRKKSDKIGLKNEPSTTPVYTQYTLRPSSELEQADERDDYQAHEVEPEYNEITGFVDATYEEMEEDEENDDPLSLATGVRSMISALEEHASRSPPDVLRSVVEDRLKVIPVSPKKMAELYLESPFREHYLGDQDQCRGDVVKIYWALVKSGHITWNGDTSSPGTWRELSDKGD